MDKVIHISSLPAGRQVFNQPSLKSELSEANYLNQIYSNEIRKTGDFKPFWIKYLIKKKAGVFIFFSLL